jgi:hypothetical protein
MPIPAASDTVALSQPNDFSSGSIRTPGAERRAAADSRATNTAPATTKA